MQRTIRIALAPACGLALSTKPHGHFMALTQTQANCDPSAYTGPADYGDLCAAIDADCAAKLDALRGSHSSNLNELEEACKREKSILAGREEDHSDEKADVEKQEDVVGAEHMDVKDARKTVADLAQCRPVLFAAREELSKQEAIPNDDSQAIDDECRARKAVMEAERCVPKLEAAEKVLSKQKDQHSDEKSDLNEEEGEATAAGAKVPPQERQVEIVCGAWEDAKNKPGPSIPDCGGDRKLALIKQADKYIEDLLAEYLRQKKILEGKEDTHADEKSDVDAQEKVVSAERKDVVQARSDVKEFAHCPPELEKAEAELSKQQGIPDETPADIDAECEATKAVMEAKKCVEKLRAAEKILATQKDQHSDENSELSAEASEEDKAAAALPPQEKIVCDLKAALDAARAARDTLPCDKPQKQEKSEPEPAPEPEKKSGAARAATATALIAVLLGAVVQA